MWVGIGCPDPFSPSVSHGHCDQGAAGLYMNSSDDALVIDGRCDTSSRHSAFSCEVAVGTLTLTHRELRQYIHQGMYNDYLFCDETPFS